MNVVERMIALLRDACPDVEYVDSSDEQHRCYSCDTSAATVAEVMEILKGRAEALARVRTWVEGEVADWADPVISPQLNDDLRLVAGLSSIDREDSHE